MIPAQAKVQAPSHTQPLPQAAAVEDGPGCNAVAQLQSQIDSLQAQLFHFAVARQMALSSAEHYVGAPTLADVNADVISDVDGTQETNSIRSFSTYYQQIRIAYRLNVNF